ncbi:MAG: hypothetical protein H6765_04325 [Candidatus Peribacteria bacterium]|nr:MAG: hypothetical protein H6765_04325 [Candidatus Peribacteria bacterium]
MKQYLIFAMLLLIISACQKEEEEDVLGCKECQSKYSFVSSPNYNNGIMVSVEAVVRLTAQECAEKEYYSIKLFALDANGHRVTGADGRWVSAGDATKKVMSQGDELREVWIIPAGWYQSYSAVEAAFFCDEDRNRSGINAAYPTSSDQYPLFQ